VLTGNTDPAVHQDVLLKGARGVIEKSVAADVILRAIERVHAGEVWANRELVGKLLGALVAGTAARTQIQERIATLTPREREIVRSVAGNAGVKGTAIASQLNVSESTLRNHLTVIYEKLSVRNRVELVLFATEHGLAPPRGASAPREDF
jgi:DNA-binding NarL/FixJ family response regulator